MRLAIVDDDQKVLVEMRKHFEGRCELAIPIMFEVEIYHDKGKALDEIPYKNFDVLIIDLNLGISPLDGLDLVSDLRKKGCNANVFIHTSNYSSGYFLDAISLNICGVMFKEIDLNMKYQQLAYQMSVLKHATTYYWGGVKFNYFNKTVEIMNVVIILSDLEFRVLHLIVSNDTKVTTIEEMNRKVWNDTASRITIQNTIKNVRNKLGDFGNLIKTNEGSQGYCLNSNFWKDAFNSTSDYYAYELKRKSGKFFKDIFQRVIGENKRKTKTKS